MTRSQSEGKGQMLHFASSVSLSNYAPILDVKVTDRGQLSKPSCLCPSQNLFITEGILRNDMERHS